MHTDKQATHVRCRDCGATYEHVSAFNPAPSYCGICGTQDIATRDGAKRTDDFTSDMFAPTAGTSTGRELHPFLGAKGVL